MYDYFRNCSSNRLHVCCENSPTKRSIYLFSVRWPCSSFNVSSASQPWRVLSFSITCTIIARTWTVFKLLHSNLAWWQTYAWQICPCSRIRPWCKVTEGRQRQTNQRWFFSTTKQAISIKLATAVSHFLCDLDFENVYIAWRFSYLLQCIYSCWSKFNV